MRGQHGKHQPLFLQNLLQPVYQPHDELRLGRGLGQQEVQQGAQQAAISLICDVSGSMQGAKFNEAISTVEDLIANAPDGIYLQVVVFDDYGDEVLPMTPLQPGTDRRQLVEQFRAKLRQVRIFGGTAMSQGINVALKGQQQLYDDPSTPDDDIARYGIFLSDGQNTENEAKLVRAVQEAAEIGLHLCAYGYGSDWTPEQLTKMAQITNGWMPKAVPNPEDLRAEFNGLISRMAQTVASDAALHLWTPTGARILSLSQAYPEWIKNEAAPMGDGHTWVIPVPPMAAKDHRDYLVHIQLAQVGARVVATKPSITYATGGQRVEEKADQASWMILEQTNDPGQINQVHPVVAGYLNQGQLAASTRAMTEALNRGDQQAAERHRTEALDIAQAAGNRTMTQVLEAAGEAGTRGDVARKTAALGTATVNLTDV